MVYEEVKNENTIWIPEESGQSIEGEVVELFEGQFGTQAKLKTEDGEILTPSHKWLQNILSNVKVGDKVRIEFTGTEPPQIKGHSPTKKYKLFVDM